MTEEDNFAAYRAELDSLPGPCIPFLGNVLTQIAQTQAYASIRRKRQKRAKESPTPADKVSTDETDGARPNGVAKCNGYRNDETTPPPPRPVSPRDMYKRHPKKEPQSKSRDRTPKSASRISKNRRKYGRYSSDTGIIGNRIRTASSEQLASPVDSLDRTLNLSRSDSVIANTMALEEEQGQSSPASARPALLRRLSESSSSASSLNGKSRRFSEASRPSSFLRNFVKRSQSSHSVKEGSLSRKASSERLSVSACNMKDECLLSRDTFARLGPAKSTPTVRATRDQLPGEVAQACGQSLSTKSSGTSTESRDSTSGMGRRFLLPIRSSIRPSVVRPSVRPSIYPPARPSIIHPCIQPSILSHPSNLHPCIHPSILDRRSVGLSADCISIGQVVLSVQSPTRSRGHAFRNPVAEELSDRRFCGSCRNREPVVEVPAGRHRVRLPHPCRGEAVSTRRQLQHGGRQLQTVTQTRGTNHEDVTRCHSRHRRPIRTEKLAEKARLLHWKI